jgi:hypothetical protein
MELRYALLLKRVAGQFGLIQPLSGEAVSRNHQMHLLPLITLHSAFQGQLKVKFFSVLFQNATIIQEGFIPLFKSYGERKGYQ